MSLLNIHRRVGHIAVIYGDHVLVWGGFKRDEKQQEVYHPTNEIWFYHCKTEVWYPRCVIGPTPNPNSGATAIVCEDYLYIFGGVEAVLLPQENCRYSCDLHRVDLKKMTWTTLDPSGVPPHGCDKGVGWSHAGKLYVFGGYGERKNTISVEHSFDADVSNIIWERGWHNQLMEYNPSTDSWSTPQTKGIAPQPRATHTAEVRGDRVYIFGGRVAAGRVNDLHFLHLPTMTWTKLRVSTETVPEGRSWHSFNFISDNRAILYGGLNSQGSPCNDWWESRIDGSEVTWCKRGRLERSLVWHKAVLSPATQELLIIGGVTCSPYHMQAANHVEELTAIRYSPPSLLRLSLRGVIKHGLWQESCLPKYLREAAIVRTTLL